ncbi:hypothetical protein C8F04DRAFT_1126082 [Mycena alexandri]|uniref:BTB domain-containing protein n=1 Tax=Mycena alexandri TaxID=1745969 RepID=A0AAD6SH90_9AGAR|nr:hypothetical protein C8F04DRAFT_1126082 [Mycena alexandri]
MQIEGSSGPSLIKEESLWFLDATLVLRAENRLFRVFPGILGAKSHVFRDMLAFPQPENGETFDGCPLVRLADSAADMTYFLKAIFHYDFFDAGPNRAEFPVVAGILRLSQKYQVDPLRKRALVHFSERCATSLQKWEEHEEWTSEVNPILVVNLAREVSADWVLPGALAACFRVDPSTLVHGMPAGDGSIITLSPVDLVLCLQGAVKLHTGWTSRLCDFLWEPREIPGCESPHQCLLSRVKIRRTAEEWRNASLTPLDLWDEEDWDLLETGVCTICLSCMQESQEVAKEEYWQALPEIFGLPGWPTLLTLKHTALNDA